MTSFTVWADLAVTAPNGGRLDDDDAFAIFTQLADVVHNGAADGTGGYTDPTLTSTKRALRQIRCAFAGWAPDTTHAAVVEIRSVTVEAVKP